MPKITDEEAHDALNKGTEKVTEDDFKTVLDKQSVIEGKFKGPLERFVDDLKLLFAIIQDYISGEYREIPWRSIAAIVAALLYVLSPVDLIPDFIPIIGLVDDALVVAACLAMVESDLKDYEVWREKNGR